MNIIELKTAPELVRVIKSADNTYRKMKAFLRVGSTVTLSNTYWDGGSRSTYTAVCLTTGHNKGAPQYAPPQFGGPANAPTVSIPEGIAIVETGVFQGKTATATVYLNPANVAKLIPA